jgi:uncharacterized protein with FMN-binding domain
MKKIFIGIFVVATFVIYSLYGRDNKTAVTTPTTSSATSTPATSNNSSTPAATGSVTYKDGQYTGNPADAYYGNIQVQATISGGKITDVVFLQHPSDRRDSVEINNQAMPILKQEAIQAQTAQVNTVSGATDTSQAFIQSLTSALKSAQA